MIKQLSGYTLSTLRFDAVAGLTAAAGMMLYHYTLIRDRSREGCFRAFRHASWAGLAWVFVHLLRLK